MWGGGEWLYTWAVILVSDYTGRWLHRSITTQAGYTGHGYTVVCVYMCRWLQRRVVKKAYGLLQL